MTASSLKDMNMLQRMMLISRIVDNEVKMIGAKAVIALANNF